MNKEKYLFRQVSFAMRVSQLRATIVIPISCRKQEYHANFIFETNSLSPRDVRMCRRSINYHTP